MPIRFGKLRLRNVGRSAFELDRAEALAEGFGDFFVKAVFALWARLGICAVCVSSADMDLKIRGGLSRRRSCSGNCGQENSHQCL